MTFCSIHITYYAAYIDYILSAVLSLFLYNYKGVLLSLFSVFTLHPNYIKSDMAYWLPWEHAKCKLVLPFKSVCSKSIFICSCSNFIYIVLLSWAALCITDMFFLFFSKGFPPSYKRYINNSLLALQAKCKAVHPSSMKVRRFTHWLMQPLIVKSIYSFDYPIAEVDIYWKQHLLNVWIKD